MEKLREGKTDSVSDLVIVGNPISEISRKNLVFTIWLKN